MSTPAQSRATHKNYLAKKAAGLCPRCGVVLRDRSFVECDVCREKGRVRSASRKEMLRLRTLSFFEYKDKVNEIEELAKHVKSGRRQR